MKARLLQVFGIVLLSFYASAKDLPFPVGEELVYHVTWNGVPVAWSKATTQMERIDGRSVLALRVETRTYSFFDHFFKVEDFHESLVDPDTFLPIRYTKNLNEGKFKCREVTVFDYRSGRAHYTHQDTGEKKSYEIESDTRDLVSFMYFMRSASLAEDSTDRRRVMADEKIYDLIIRSSSVKKIDLPDYKKDVPCLQMVPEAAFDGLFVHEGEATLWVSRDPRRLLTYAKVKVPFGRVRIKLHAVNGPGNDFWILEKKDDD